MVVLLMVRGRPRSTRTATPWPGTALFRCVEARGADGGQRRGAAGGAGGPGHASPVGNGGADRADGRRRGSRDARARYGEGRAVLIVLARRAIARGRIIIEGRRGADFGAVGDACACG